MPVKINYQNIPEIEKLLWSGDAIPGLKEHFNDPENQRRFEEWQKRRQELNSSQATRKKNRK